jgi:hypothetical protein
MQQMAFRVYSPGVGQRLAVELNGGSAGELDLAEGWQEVTIPLPASLVKEGMNEIWLRWSEVFPTHDVQLLPRTIGQTGVESPVNLAVRSAGQEVGDLGLIYVDGKQASPNERGYNVVVIEPQSGEVESTVSFDTHLDENASRALAEMLNAVPEGRIVAVAAADEASRLLGPEAVEALRGIGAEGDLRGKFRWGHAIVGVRGAAPGSAAESMGWMRPVSVVVGEGATEPHLAAAVESIRLR